MTSSAPTTQKQHQLAWTMCLRHQLAAKSMVPISWLVPRQHQQAFGILAYHRVSPIVIRGSIPSLSVTPSRLYRQLQGLQSLGFTAWPLRRAVEAHLTGQPIPRNVFVVTFDDAYAGVLYHALPVLAELKVHATVFVPTGHLDTRSPRPFDHWGLANADMPDNMWRVVNSDECRRLHESDWIEVGSHTHQHQDFGHDNQAFAADMEASVRRLRDGFGIERPLFSFPFGVANEELLEIARQSNVACGLTTDSQLVTPNDDVFRWGRFGAEQYDTPRTLAAKLNGVYSLFQNGWRRFKRTARIRW